MSPALGIPAKGVLSQCPTGNLSKKSRIEKHTASIRHACNPRNESNAMSATTLKPGTSQDQWNQVGANAANAAASVSEMANHAACAVGSMAKQAACDVAQKADDLTAKAGGRIEQMGHAIGERLPHEGAVGQASQVLAQTIQQGGQYMEDAKLSGAAASVKELIRRYPVESTLVGLAAGYLMARVLKK